MRRRSFLFAAGAAAVPDWSAESSLGTIAYIQADGRWTRDLPAGHPKRLVDDANLKAPRFSPSGKWIAYFQDNVLQVVSRQDGKAIALGEASQAQWLPTHDELLLGDEAGLKLLTSANGFRTATRQITNASLPAVFSTNGTEMVYSDFVTGGRGPGGEPMRANRYIRNIRTMRPIVTLPNGRGSERGPILSRDREGAFALVLFKIPHPMGI